MQDSKQHLNINDHELSLVIIQLFKGVIYREQHEKIWEILLTAHTTVIDYLNVLYLELILDEAEGYAFLKQKENDENTNYPRLINRRALGFEVSLLLVLLRKSLVEFDAHGNDSRFIISHHQISNLLKVYLADSSNQAKQDDKISTIINKVVELGFLSPLKNQQSEIHYEIKRIIKAFIDIAWLQQFNQWLDTCLVQSRSDDES